MPQGQDPLKFNRREAMLLSVAAGIGIASARDDGPCGCVEVGTGEYRQLRRGSRSGDDLRPIGRRIQGHHADGHACRGGHLPSRRSAVGGRRQHPFQETAA